MYAYALSRRRDRRTVCRCLQRLRPPARGAYRAGQARGRAGSHAACAIAALRRPLQGQGEQGQASAKPRQGTGKADLGASTGGRIRSPLDSPAPAKLPDPLLQIRGAAAGYGERRVLENVSMFLEPGDRVGLLGRNGAGKSTFMKLLAGVLEPFSGERKAGARSGHRLFRAITGRGTGSATPPRWR